MQIAMKQEVETGAAQILTTIDDGTPKLYDCEIEKVHFNDESLTDHPERPIGRRGHPCLHQRPHERLWNLRRKHV